MKNFISICLVLIMATSVTVPLLVQWQGDDVCEMKESKSDDDADDTFKIGKEKEIYRRSGDRARRVPTPASRSRRVRRECAVPSSDAFVL